MSNEARQRWINAGIAIAENVNAQILCPVCQSSILKVIDIRSETDSELLERQFLSPIILYF